MKTLVLVVLAALSIPSFGVTYCRNVRPILGSPSAAGRHCLIIEDGNMRDNAPAFFGNPPTSHPIRVVGDKVQVRENGTWMNKYTIIADKLVSNEGVVFKLTDE